MFVIRISLHLMYCTLNKNIMAVKVKVRALKYHRVAGEMREPGQVYSVTPEVAKELVRLEKAENLKAKEEDKPKAEAKEAK